MSYRLNGDGTGMRLSDSAVFPLDSRDAVYADYLVWLKAGGTPEIDDTPPEPVATIDEKIAALEASLAAERAKVGQLENFLAGNGNAAAPDARTDIKAIIAALTAKEIITTAEIDAQRRSSYRDNGDGTISLLDKFGSPSVTFTPGDDVPEASVYATWLAMGGKPMPPAAALEANNAP